MMKKLQLTVNIVLGIAVLALFILFFTARNSGSGNSESLFSYPEEAGDSRIVYVQIDSVIANYEMAIDMADDLDQSLQTSENRFLTQQQTYQSEVNDYQDKYNRGLLTRTEATNIEQQLYVKQQELLQLQQELSDELAEKQAVMNNQLVDAIMQFLNNNRDRYNYTYVLGTSFGGNILYANDSLDITADVIEGLNEEYREQLESRR